jgi:hypothetical protein
MPFIFIFPEWEHPPAQKPQTASTSFFKPTTYNIQHATHPPAICIFAGKSTDFENQKMVGRSCPPVRLGPPPILPCRAVGFAKADVEPAQRSSAFPPSSILASQPPMPPGKNREPTHDSRKNTVRPRQTRQRPGLRQPPGAFLKPYANKNAQKWEAKKIHRT